MLQPVQPIVLHHINRILYITYIYIYHDPITYILRSINLYIPDMNRPLGSKQGHSEICSWGWRGKV